MIKTHSNANGSGLPLEFLLVTQKESDKRNEVIGKA